MIHCTPIPSLNTCETSLKKSLKDGTVGLGLNSHRFHMEPSCLCGNGKIPSLHQVMARDPGGRLQQIVEQFVASDDPLAAKELVKDILYQWAGVADLGPDCGGQYLPDGRILYALERLWGSEFIPFPEFGGKPGPDDGPNLINAFEDWKVNIEACLFLQTHYSEWYESVTASYLNAIYRQGISAFEADIAGLRELYDSADPHDTLVARDMIFMLNVYDPCGRAIVRYLARHFGDPESEDGLVRDLSRAGLWEIEGTAGNDILRAEHEEAVLIGGAGDDVLCGGDGDDILYAGVGNDTLYGGNGGDIYIFGRGDGHDVIMEQGYGADRGNAVHLRGGLGPQDIDLMIGGMTGTTMDLIIRICDTGETLTIHRGLSWFTANESNPYSIQAITFDDGTVWRWQEILSQPLFMADGLAETWADVAGSTVVGNDLDNIIYGSAVDDMLFGEEGNDTLLGYAGDDALHGGAGNDYLYGGNGDDIYLFGRGDGHDVIGETEIRANRRNVIHLLGNLAPGDVELLIGGTTGTTMDLIIRIKDTGETLTVSRGLSWFESGVDNQFSIQAIEFEDGTTWEWRDILKQPLHLSDSLVNTRADVAGSVLVGNGFNNDLYGSPMDDMLSGGDGNDILSGNAGNDVLHGGDGDDWLYGYADNDVLWGGSGNDHLEGGVGDDTYLFGIGDGHDIIRETETRVGRRNVIRLDDGIGVGDIELQARMIGHKQSDLIIRLKSTGETLTVAGGIHCDVDNFQNSASIQAIEFADGTTWEWADVIKQPMQVLQGGFSNNGIVPFSGGFLVGNDGDNILYANQVDSILHGGGGNDEVWGYLGNDTLWGGTGNDVLYGQSGDDVYLFGRGDGQDTIVESSGNDTLSFLDGIDAADLWFSRSGNSLVIDVIGSGDTVTVQNWYSHADYQVETIAAGGSALASAQMDQLIQALASYGEPAGVGGQWKNEQKEGVNSVISAYWKPTGS